MDVSQLHHGREFSQTRMTRNPLRTILATFHAMLAVQTIGSVDGEHKLPAPKQYVAHSIVWGALFLAAEMGFGRLAARLSVLILLTATVVGPFGARLIAFLGMIANRFGNASGVAPTDPQQQDTPSPPSNVHPA